MTAYNAEKYISQAIASIINQSHEDWELIVVDDCSTDGTRGEVAEIFLHMMHKMKMVKLKKNEGHTKALNTALKLTQGSHIAWMDADDISEPTRFESQLKCFKDNVGIVTTHGISIDEKGKRIKDWYTDKAQRRTPLEIKIHSEVDWWCMGPSMMFKREVVEKIGGFDEECFTGQDFNFWLRAIEHFGWEVCEMELYRLRRHKGSVRKTKKARERNWHQFAIEQAKSKPIVGL